MYFCTVNFKTKQHQVKNGFSIFGLALLFLLSPCQVRHLVQDAFEVPQTKVTNLNKAELSNTQCQLFNVVQSEIKNPELSKSFCFNDPSEQGNQIHNYSNIKTPFYDLSVRSFGRIPLYILYRHLKVHL
ncbi:hypothetical protein V8G58_05675 [Gaetbulibacter aestuarii]|uniref:Uncharacterized protein n=2 Tax=Gaetbulibacter aestuarii TaxID=1502358 RepID=A0ABW7N086_9FLAO